MPGIYSADSSPNVADIVFWLEVLTFRYTIGGCALLATLYQSFLWICLFYRCRICFCSGFPFFSLAARNGTDKKVVRSAKRSTNFPFLVAPLANRCAVSLPGILKCPGLHWNCTDAFVNWLISRAFSIMLVINACPLCWPGDLSDFKAFWLSENMTECTLPGPAFV